MYSATFHLLTFRFLLGSSMPKITFTSSPVVTTVKKYFSSKTPKRLSERMSPEEAKQKFDQTKLAPSMLNQPTSDSTDTSEQTILLCHSCGFQTSGSLRTHLEHHIKKFSQQCHLCSYTCRKKKELAHHLKNHHITNRLLISEPKKVEQQAGSGEPVRKRKYYNCSQCDYKSSNNSSLNWHIHKKHPIATNSSSTSPRKAPFSKLRRHGDKNELLPNSSPDNKIHRNDPANKKVFILYKCDLCDYEINKKSNFEHHRQFHVKKSAYQCHRCSYSVSVTQRLTYHLKNHHSELDQAGSELLRQVSGENTSPRHESKRVKSHHGNEESRTNEEKLGDLDSVLICNLCNFSTGSVAQMTIHESCHSSNLKRKCPLCSFSSSLRNVALHVTNHHGDDAASSSSKPEKVNSSVTLTDVNLPPVKPTIKQRDFDAEERSCREDIALLEEVLQSDLRYLESASIKLIEREEQMQSMRTQVEIAKENLLTMEKRLKDVQLQKKENVKQKREATKKKMRAEFDLRAQQCKALELALIALEAGEEDHLENEVATEKGVKSLENQLGEVLKALTVLKEEEKALSDELQQCEACHLAAIQSLSTSQTELEALESVWKADANSLNQLVDFSKERIQAFYQLEKQLLDIELWKNMEHLSQKKTSYLLSLKSVCDG